MFFSSGNIVEQVNQWTPFKVQLLHVCALVENIQTNPSSSSTNVQLIHVALQLYKNFGEKRSTLLSSYYDYLSS